MDQQNVLKLLKNLRGQRSQKEMSFLLGLKEDEYHRWEGGYKKIKLNEFKKLLNAIGLDLEIICKKTIQLIAIPDNAKDIVLLLEKQFPCDLEVFLSRASFSESKWWRLKNEIMDMSLIDFFTIIHYRSYKLYKVFRELKFSEYHLDFTPKELSEGVDIFKFYMKEYDFFPALTASIYLQDVINSKTLDEKCVVISNILKQPVGSIQKIINSLINDKVLILNSDSNLEFATFENNFGPDDRDINKKIFSNLYKESIDCMNLDKDAANEKKLKFNFRVAPVSKDAQKKIQELQTRLSNEIYNIIINDSPDERTMIINYISSSFIL